MVVVDVDRHWSTVGVPTTGVDCGETACAIVANLEPDCR